MAAIGLWRAIALAWVCDDSFISFRYALNLIEGSGLVYNPGERVEGYSNLLWTLLVALWMRLGADPVSHSHRRCGTLADFAAPGGYRSRP